MALKITKQALNSRLILAVAVMAVAVLVIGLTADSSVKQTACGSYRSDKTVSVGTQKITAEVAATATTREKGLSGRPCIPSNQAMLFIFDQPGTYSFWMKDMKFPIDMVWLGADHKTVAIEENIAPSTYPAYRYENKSMPAQYVLELHANRSISLGIKLGTTVNF